MGKPLLELEEELLLEELDELEDELLELLDDELLELLEDELLDDELLDEVLPGSCPPQAPRMATRAEALRILRNFIMSTLLTFYFVL